MSMVVKSESFENAIIDTSDMTITEYDTDSVRTYSLLRAVKTLGRRCWRYSDNSPQYSVAAR